ncbi:MAG: hypothetical protein LBL76_06210 [Treponema sp.]|jgi:hypothetical protein|nr:hypothetical protein [Treponema sp.]
MSGNEDWVPETEQDLQDLCETWDDGLADPANTTAFGWKPEEVTLTRGRVSGFPAARAAYREDNSTRNRIKKDEAKEAAKADMRDFANTSIRYNKLMAEEDKRY